MESPAVRLIAAVAVAAAVTGCARRGDPVGPAPPAGPVSVLAQLQITSLSLPDGAGDDFGLCPPGIALVPTDVGVAVAGWQAYASTPDTGVVDSLGCDADGNVLFVRGGALWRRDADGVQTSKVIDLPRGEWHVVSTVAHPAWLWGKTKKGAWAVLRYDKADGLQQVLSVSKPIGALGAVGLDRAVVAVGPRLVLLGPGGTKDVLAELDAPADGLAMMPDGSLIVSTRSGLSSLATDGTIQPVATGLHGPLLANYLTVYVLSTELNAVVRLAP